jgi:hypothetical protein
MIGVRLASKQVWDFCWQASFSEGFGVSEELLPVFHAHMAELLEDSRWRSHRRRTPM